MIDLDDCYDHYAAGLEVGRSWRYDYMPGGPFAPHGDETMRRERTEWLRGFADGLRDKEKAELPRPCNHVNECGCPRLEDL